ncbi:MAG: carbon storage regulator CsrA [Bacillota bacterium]|nr:carbon storage regulator CsrA [Bacillota bacterium]
MLVLTRKKGQSIIVGDGIEISVVDVNGDSVRIGVSAPREISIYRREIYEAIREENISAARTASEMASQFKKAAHPSPDGKEEGKKD